MTTSADVRTAWKERVFESAGFQELTECYFLEDPTRDSEFDLARLVYDADDGNGPLMNFVTCLVSRRTTFGEMGMKEYQFDVQVYYHLQKSGVADSTQNTVQDGLEVIDELILPALGDRWAGTVDYFTPADTLRPEEFRVQETVCWRGGLRYTAFKRVSI